MHMRSILKAPPVHRRLAARLRGCASGLALLEFALSLPVLTTLVLVGLETANLAMAHLRVSNIAMLASDNASRVRDSIDEADVIQLLTGAKMTGTAISFRNHGRIILSSIEPNTAGTNGASTGQWIRWQRCDGAKVVVSGYGAQGTGQNSAVLQAVGPAGQPDRCDVGHRDHAGRGRLRLSAAGLQLDLRGAHDPLRERVQRAPAHQPGDHQRQQRHAEELRDLRALEPPGLPSPSSC